MVVMRVSIGGISSTQLICINKLHNSDHHALIDTDQLQSA